MFDYQFRLILIGDSTVGKSSLLKYFTDGRFSEVSDPTVGVDFFARLIEVQNGAKIKLQLWDTAGQERFRSITKCYYRNSVGALLVYDVCNRTSFENIPLWMAEAKNHIEPHRPVFALVGCKLDLVKTGTPRQVSEEEVREFAMQYDLFHIETSAKTGYNAEKAFAVVAQEIYSRIQNGEYKVEEGWDGIKPGFVGLNTRTTDYNYLEAEAARASFCC